MMECFDVLDWILYGLMQVTGIVVFEKIKSTLKGCCQDG